MVKKEEDVAWMSDIHIGTVFYNPKYMDAVGKILAGRNIKAVVINGGLLPRVPSHFGKTNAQYFEILDNDVGAKYGENVEEKVRQIHSFKEESENNGKVGIDSLDELIEVVQPEIEKISIPAETLFYYVWGEEDYANVADLIETKIRELIKLKDVKKGTLTEQLERAQDTLNAKEEEIKAKKTELFKIKRQIKVLGDDEKIKKLNKEMSKLTGELEHLNIAYQSFEKHMVSLESEKDAITKGIRSFTKTWQLSPSEYSNERKTGVKNRALKAYKEIVYPMFKGKHLRLISHLEDVINLSGITANISHNRNAITSNAILSSAIKRRVGESKLKNRRGENITSMDVESHHAGGFKIYAQKKNNESDETVYFMQVPSMQDPKEVRNAKNRWVRTWDTKRIDSPFASGLTLTRKLDNEVLEVEFFSSELLEKIASQDKFEAGEEVKIEVISDMHIGAPNEPGFITNYQLIEAIKKYQEATKLPDIVVVGGDAINGQHLDQIIHEYLGKVPSEYEGKREEIIKSGRKKQVKEKLLDKLDKEQAEQSPIGSISKQKEELKRRLYDDYWKKVLENGGELIFVSGQHYNKSVRSKEDEATELANMVDSQYKNKVHVFSGQEIGSGSAKIKGIDIYAIHAPKRGQDEVSGLINHMAGINKKADLAVGGDYHHAGAGYADGTAYVAAAGLQPWNKYVDQIGKQGSVRGIINVYLSHKNKGYARFEFVLDEALKKIIEKK